MAQLQQTTEETPLLVTLSALEPTTRPDTPLPETQEIEQIFRKQHHRKFIKELAHLRSSRDPLTEVEFIKIMAKLREESDCKRPERVYAAWLLGRLPLTEAQRAMAVPLLQDIALDRNANWKQRAERRFLGTARRFMFASLACVLLALISLISLKQTPSGEDITATTSVALVFFGLCVAIKVVILPISFVCDANQPDEVRSMAVTTLAQLQATETLEAILETLCETTDPVRLFLANKNASPVAAQFRDRARAALAQMLPLITEEHYGQLGAKFTPRLCEFMMTLSENPVYLCAVLEALGKVGDGRAVESVQRFSKHPNAKVRESVERILPILQTRRELERSQATLLRAAQAPPVPNDELLRSAPTGSLTPDVELLHPIEQRAPGA